MEEGTDWVVRLGREEWLRYTYERPQTDSLRLLGSVTRGPQIGALAVDSDGHYLQINGDYMNPLNSVTLRRAVAAAKRFGWPPRVPDPQEASRVPVVTIKRRRLVSPTDRTRAESAST
jgi:hypothetical protein